ncbi:MAG: DUF92 domain-containing protein [Thaumarchaeota archaeon]|nr:DUF92 domain-containing protein [Nitrososphaerota archaeon]
MQLEVIVALALLALLSLKFRVLDWKGVLTAIPVGYVILVFGDLRYFVILLVFYAVSGLATKVRVRKVGKGFSEKDWVRSWRNVLANGLIPTLVIIFAALSNRSGSNMMTAGYLGGIGTAFADTLATEIGLLYPRDPRLITSFKRVERGRPGAVSPYGYAGGLLAVIVLCGSAYLLGFGDVRVLLAASFSAMLGMTFDSFLGATIQAKYRCVVCGKITESRIHCGEKAEKVSGLETVNTHVVNLIAILAGSLISIALMI